MFESACLFLEYEFTDSCQLVRRYGFVGGNSDWWLLAIKSMAKIRSMTQRWVFVLLVPVLFVAWGCAAKRERLRTLKSLGYLEGPAASIFRGDPLEVLPEYAPSRGLVISYHLTQRRDKLPCLLRVLENFDLYILMPRTHEGRKDARLMMLVGAIEGAAHGDRREKLLERIHPFEVSNGDFDGAALKGDEAWNDGIWARDWGPTSARMRRKEAGERSDAVFIEANYFVSRPYQDGAPLGFVEYLRGRMREDPEVELFEGEVGGVLHGSLPVYLSWGNFLIGGDAHGFVASAPLFARIEGMEDREKRIFARWIARVLRRDVGCRRVSILETMPYERTGHIDMWGKFVSAETILVSSLEEGQRVDVPKPFVGVFDEIRAYLDERAQEIEGMGYRVVRIPNPVPIFTRDEEMIFRSYANSLLMVGEDGRGTAFVPRYARSKVGLWGGRAEYPDAGKAEEAEKRVEAVLRDAGYEVMFVPADDLIAEGGAIHCVGMQVSVTGAEVVNH